MGVYYEAGNRRRRKAYGSQSVPGTGTEYQYPDRQQAGAGIALRQLAIKASSTLSPVPPSGTPNPHRLEETIARMMDMEQEVDEAIDGLVELKADIMKAISRVPDDRERVVLELRYLAFKDWASIADALGLHIRQVYRLHDEALKHIEIPGECH
jgi:DNA-directed RNA polymerase specialized sigma24 family protein